MPARTIIAAVSGLAAGIALTLVAVDGLSPGGFGKIALDTSVRFFPLVCVAVIAHVALRRWYGTHVERTRQDVVSELHEQGRVLSEQLIRRCAELDAREEWLDRSAANGQIQLLNSVKRLDEMHTALTAERQQRADLQKEFDELAGEYNSVVQQLMQDRASMFSRRNPVTRAPRVPAPPPEHASKALEPSRATPHPSADVPTIGRRREAIKRTRDPDEECAPPAG